MLTYIKIDGFKSFHNFEMTFAPMTVVAGTNAAGKSNLFDALKLLSSLATSDKISKSFKEQRGDLSELFTKYPDGTDANEMSFVTEMLVQPVVKDNWGGEEVLKYTRLRYELSIKRTTNSLGMEDVELLSERLDTIKHNEDKWVKLIPQSVIEKYRPKVTTGKRQKPYLYTDEYNGVRSVFIPQDGTSGRKRVFPLINASQTVLSSVDSVEFRHILAAREEMKSWKFLQLNPEDLRMPTSKQSGDNVMSASGKYLAAALYRISLDNQYHLKEISRRLNEFIPEFTDVNVVDDVENKQYRIDLRDREKNVFTSRVLSEGTLRILALCILERDMKYDGLLCFEEPENGIHPARLDDMAQLLKNLVCTFEYEGLPLRQIIVNTHSPVFASNMSKWLMEKWLTIAFIQSHTAIVTIRGVKKKMRVSDVQIVPKVDLESNPILPGMSCEDKLSIRMIVDYLQTQKVRDE